VVTIALPGGRSVRVAPLICYDVLVPAHVLAAVGMGAELIVTLSNDSWFQDTAGPRLHLVGAIFRSLEARRPQVRVTNTGISGVITATGDVVTAAGVGERTTLAAALAPRSAPASLMVRWGDWFGPAALVAGLVLAGAGSVLPRAGDRRVFPSDRELV
jgi:apolipoprotein N-acyltransferase